MILCHQEPFCLIYVKTIWDDLSYGGLVYVLCGRSSLKVFTADLISVYLLSFLLGALLHQYPLEIIYKVFHHSYNGFLFLFLSFYSCHLSHTVVWGLVSTLYLEWPHNRTTFEKRYPQWPDW